MCEVQSNVNENMEGLEVMLTLLYLDTRYSDNQQFFLKSGDINGHLLSGNEFLIHFDFTYLLEKSNNQ